MGGRSDVQMVAKGSRHRWESEGKVGGQKRSPSLLSTSFAFRPLENLSKGENVKEELIKSGSQK